MTASSTRARQFKKFVYSSITYPLLLLTVFSLILSWRVVALISAARDVDHSDAIIAKANQTEMLIVDEESSQRGYFVNGDKDFLDRYAKSPTRVNSAFESLLAMVSDSDFRTSLVSQLRSEYLEWQAESASELNLSAAYPTSYRGYFDQSREQTIMRQLRQNFDSFINDENTLRSERDATTVIAAAETLIIAAVLAVLFALGLSLTWMRQTREFAGQYEDALTISVRNVTLLSTTLMSIGDAVMVTDARGKVLQMNSIAEELTGWRFSDAYGMDANAVFKTVDRLTRASLESPIIRVTTEGKTVKIADKAILIRQDRKELAIDDTCSPIRDDDGTVVGAVLVFRDVTERNRAERELARLYEREHRIAENLQRSLLSKPDPKLFPQLDVETFYQPAWAEAKVGGDYYDIVNLQGGRAALVVGDVSGKGLKAASRTAEMKFTLRAYLREGTDVADAVSRLNKFVCQTHMMSDDTASFFLCVTVIVIDTNSGKASVCVSGSEPPLLVHKDGKVEPIDAAGTPVGVFDDSEYSAVEVDLAHGDTIVVSTDGITEARRSGEFLGNDGLARLAAKFVGKKNLNDMGTFIVDEVKQFANQQLSDDVCLLLVRRK